MFKALWKGFLTLLKKILMILEGIWNLVKLLLNLLWRGILRVVNMAIDVLRGGVYVAKEILYNTWKISKKYAIPVVVGGIICYYSPTIACAIAAIPLIGLLDRKIGLTPALKVLTTVAAFVLIERLFFLSPICVFFLCIHAIGRDFQTWKERIRKWAQDMYDRGLKALKEAEAAATALGAA